MGREGGRREEGGGAQQRRRLADRSPPPTVGTVFSLRSEAEEGNRLPSCWTLMVHTAAARPLGTAGGLIPLLPGPLRSASRCTKLRTRARSPRPGLPGPRPPPGGSRVSRQPLPRPNPALRCHSRLGLAFRQGVPRLCSSRALRVAERAPRQAAGMSHSRNPRMLTRPQPHPPRGPALRSAPTAPP